MPLKKSINIALLHTLLALETEPPIGHLYPLLPMWVFAILKVNYWNIREILLKHHRIWVFDGHTYA